MSDHQAGSAQELAHFEIARMMGTSIEQIENTYGHLLPDALERGRVALEAFDARPVVSTSVVGSTE
jgi:hypothetical protein